ncbi:MAG: VCBS repeat-containing protein [Lewinellaceae bacterium]|nr:VCBS repeat-containing protein [Lewinella sp.]MCB9281343.1 VCBS repeat-containing protein [Lewinellaceae bacterium]
MNNRHLIIVTGLISQTLLLSCTSSEKENTLFQSLTPEETGIHFINQLQATEEFNTYTFRNFYNGGGLALGDVNNDGLTDIYFCGNSADNRLYLNKGNFQFEDVTEKAGVGCPNVWSTGVAMADVNGDGLLDIYVCKSGPPGGPNRYNELFINNGDGTFSEQAKAWGIADEGLSVHAAFFDYDKDGDLDLYLLNNSLRSIGTGNDLNQNNREVRDPQGGNKLYQNEGDHYIDVSEQAGIYGSAIGFGLGVTIGDINRDGWQDIYVSNDFFEKDYLYINQHDGTFREDLESWIREISMGAMGADMADLTNDGYPEIFVTEMLPQSDARYKTKAQFEDWNTYQRKLGSGFYQQFGRNVLQLNNEDGTFSEIGRLAGVEATDWSWGALIFDMDGDGWKDIFVANGIYRDLMDQDYVNFYSNPERVRELIRTEEKAILKLIDQMPSQPMANYAFANNHDLTFTNSAHAWGLDTPGFSNGSAYGDLDNDGDPDLVVNNVNMPPFIYRNLSREQSGNNTLSVALKGEGKNTFGLGAQVTVYAGGRVFYQEQAPMRGFQSCVDPRLHFGLGALTQVDSVVVRWNSGKVSEIGVPAVNQLLTVEESKAGQIAGLSTFPEPAPTVFSNAGPLIDFVHRENRFSDFDRDRLLMQMVSSEGPRLATGDVNGDGRTDIFVCGAKDESSALFVQQADGSFQSTNQALFQVDRLSEDTDALFFDADNDGDADLYVTSGGNEFPSSSPALIDRLYLNDGKGDFTKSDQVLPSSRFESTACVEAADYDGDGDLDLFVGVRLKPFLYGAPVSSYLLENDGKGAFRNVTAEKAPGLEALGMVTDALWIDFDNDGDADLIAVGDWMPVTFLTNDRGKLVRRQDQPVIAGSEGFWHCLKAFDLDGDGDLDLVAGNHGINSRITADGGRTISMYVNDFDGNGSVEQILARDSAGRSFPFVLKTDLVSQMPGLKKKYLKFEDYKNQTIDQVFTPEQLANAVRLQVSETRSCLFINEGNGNFEMKPLPMQAQFAPMFGVAMGDFDADGHADILMGGNFSRSKPEFGIYSASYGVFLRGDGRMNFEYVPGKVSGFRMSGEVRDIEVLEDKWVVIGKNNDRVEVFQYR